MKQTETRTTMSEKELKLNSIILGERNYEAALDLIIDSAKRELLIFDQDLTHGNYASNERFRLINLFLNQDAMSQLTIVLQSADYFLQHCPRLFDLLKQYGHKMTVYETNDVAKIAKDCFVIADQQHYCRRFHIDQARFKYAFDDAAESANLHTRFSELMEETSQSITSTQLGL
jgi:predicted transcriptional regulator